MAGIQFAGNAAGEDGAVERLAQLGWWWADHSLRVRDIDRAAFVLPLSTGFNVLLLGGVLFVFGLRRLFDFEVWPLAMLSRYSLSAYVLQYVILDIIRVSVGRYPEALMGYVIGVGVTLVVLAILIGIEKTRPGLSLEGALKKVAG